MTDMNSKGLASESSQEIMEITQPLLAAQSADLSSNHLDQQVACISLTPEFFRFPLEIKQPPPAPQSVNLSSDHLEQQSADLSFNHLDQQQMNDDSVIEIENMIQDDKGNLCCIYKVPPLIRQLKEDAYTPIAISIGPIHYGDKELQDMEKYKQVLFKRFKEEAKASMDEMVSFVKGLEPKVRASYSVNIKLSESELVKLVLEDAAFIIELFKSYYKGEICKDAKLSKAYLFVTIVSDLLLLENQLPFFLIEDLFNMAFPHDLRGHLPSFLELTFHFFSGINKQKREPNPDHRIMHFTDLLRLFYLPRTQPARRPLQDRDLLQYSASKLQEAGVKFKESTSMCLLDLKFSEGVLEIPLIWVTDSTELLFRNMIVLEHCHYPYESYIIDYAVAMDCLLNTNKDVDVLIHKKIIHNWLGDTDEVAKLFNGLGKNIIGGSVSLEYIDIYKRLNEFYQSPWHKMKATLRRDYCDTPWKTVGTAVGIIVLILTTTQTIVSLVEAL